MDAMVVVPADPGCDRQLDLGVGLPGLAVDQLLFEGRVDRLGQRVVVGIGDRSDGRRGADLGQAFGVVDRKIWASSTGRCNTGLLDRA